MVIAAATAATAERRVVESSQAVSISPRLGLATATVVVAVPAAAVLPRAGRRVRACV